MKQLLQLVDLYVDLKVADEARSRLFNEKIAEENYKNTEHRKKTALISYLNEWESLINLNLNNLDSDICRISEALDHISQCINSKELIYEKAYKDILLKKERFLSDKEVLLAGKKTILRLVNDLKLSHRSHPCDHICKQIDIKQLFNLNIPTVGHIVNGVLISCSPPTMRFDCNYIGICEDKKLFIELNNYSKYNVFIVSICRKNKKCTFSFNKSHLFSLLSINQNHRFKGKKIFHNNKCLIDIGLLVGKLRHEDKNKMVTHFNLYRSSIDYSKTVFQAIE